jgi:hypothetical protein
MDVPCDSYLTTTMATDIGSIGARVGSQVLLILAAKKLAVRYAATPANGTLQPFAVPVGDATLFGSSSAAANLPRCRHA